MGFKSIIVTDASFVAGGDTGLLSEEGDVIPLTAALVVGGWNELCRGDKGDDEITLYEAEVARAMVAALRKLADVADDDISD